MDARSSSRNRRISKQQEKQAAADLGGRTQAMSGGTRLGGGADVRVQGVVRVECKVTEKDSYSLKRSDLEKLWGQATRALEIPVFQIAYRDIFGRMDKYAVVLPWEPKNEGVLGYDTYNKSIGIRQDYLKTGLAKNRVLLTFRLLGPPHVYEWEIMTWEKYLETCPNA